VRCNGLGMERGRKGRFAIKELEEKKVGEEEVGR
jgi:hypothetical protein